MTYRGAGGRDGGEGSFLLGLIMVIAGGWDKFVLAIPSEPLDDD